MLSYIFETEGAERLSGRALAASAVYAAAVPTAPRLDRQAGS